MGCSWSSSDKCEVFDLCDTEYEHSLISVSIGPELQSEERLVCFSFQQLKDGAKWKQTHQAIHSSRKDLWRKRWRAI